MMNNGLNHGSAQIYQFPVGGRSALGGRRNGETRLPANHASLPVNEDDLQRQLVPSGSSR